MMPLTMTVSMPMVEVGALRVLSVDDGVGRVAPAQLFAAGGAPPGSDAGWERDEHRAFLDGEGRLEMPVGAFVVRTGDRTILVDAGYGPEPPATVEGGASLLGHLAAHGLAPHDVTDVDEALARRTQVRIAREIEADGTPVVGAHFAGLAVGRLLPAEGRPQWVRD